MVRTDLLRAKSLHAEAAYLHDLRRVSQSKAHEEQKQKVVQEKERLFWREAVRGKEFPQHTESAPPTSAASVQVLDRMWRAHSQLKDAFGQHRSVQRALHDSLSRLASSKRCCEVVQTMVDKAQLLQQARAESRLSDEIADLAGVLRRINTAVDDTGAIPVDVASELSAPVQASTPRGDTGTAAFTPLLGAAMPTRPPLRSVDQPIAPTNSGVVRSVESVSGAVQVQSAEVHKGAQGLSLRVTCAIGNQGTLGMSLMKAEGGGIKVMLDSSGSRVASSITHDKGILQSRLQSLGIKISSIEVGRPDAVDAYAGRTGRRVRREDDEERIA
jgi:hypothetical protein